MVPTSPSRAFGKKERKNMKIAVIGVKGISDARGGIERHAEELYPRLAAKGHSITVYCRPQFTPEDLTDYKGVKIKILRSMDTKHFDAISHTFASSIDSLFRDYDIIHYHAIGPALLSFIPKVKRKTKTCVTVHGLDWQREKWGRFATLSLKMGERSAAIFPDKTITVSKELKQYYTTQYPSSSVAYIPNGVNKPEKREPDLIRSKFSLSNNGYLLFAARLVPEKGCHYLIKAFKSLNSDMKLVIAGGSSHSDSYASGLKELAAGDGRIIFTGHVSGQLLQELYSNAYAYVLPSDLEGLPIALLEALSYGLPTLCSNIPPHLEVAGRNGANGANGSNGSYSVFFKQGNIGDLANRLQYVLSEPESIRKKAELAQMQILKNYNWDEIADETEKVYASLLNRGI